VRSAAEALATIAPTNTKPAHKIPKFLMEVSSKAVSNCPRREDLRNPKSLLMATIRAKS
jgi:hypothetical protein